MKKLIIAFVALTITATSFAQFDAKNKVKATVKTAAEGTVPAVPETVPDIPTATDVKNAATTEVKSKVKNATEAVVPAVPAAIPTTVPAVPAATDVKNAVKGKSGKLY